MTSWPGVFKFATNSVLLRMNRCVFLLLVLHRVLPFSFAVYPFGLSFIYSSFPYLAPKLFCFLVIRLLVCFRAFSSYLLVEFFSVAVECPVLFVLFYHVSVSFYLPSFASTFWINSSGCIVCFACVVFLSSRYDPAFFLYFIILHIFVDFLFAFPFEFPFHIPIFSFCSCSLG